MNPEAKKAVPDDNMPESETNTDTEHEATADDEYPMILHDRMVIGLAPGAVLRVPGS